LTLSCGKKKGKGPSKCSTWNRARERGLHLLPEKKEGKGRDWQSLKLPFFFRRRGGTALSQGKRKKRGKRRDAADSKKYPARRVVGGGEKRGPPRSWGRALGKKACLCRAERESAPKTPLLGKKEGRTVPPQALLI